MILVIEWQITLLNCSIVSWKLELVSNRIGYLAEISKQSIEGEAWVFLNTYVKHNRDKFGVVVESIIKQKETRTLRF